MFTVYVLESEKGSRYTGHTENLQKRLTEHNSGTCMTTKANKSWTVVYTEELQTRSETMQREKWLKSGTGGRFAGFYFST